MINNKEFADRCRKIAESGKTLYVLGGWGQKLTNYYKDYFVNSYAFNKSVTKKQNVDGTTVSSDRAKAIRNASSDTQAFDCNCFIKAMIDTKDGKINYATPCPDITIVDMLAKYCTDISTDFSNIKVGEYVVFKDRTHCGIYIGGGKVVEALWHWKDGVQITDLGTGRWHSHAKLKAFIDYSYEEPKEEEKKSIDTGSILKHIERAEAELTAIKSLLG